MNDQQVEELIHQLKRLNKNLMGIGLILLLLLAAMMIFLVVGLRLRT